MKNRKFLAVILAVALILIFAFILSACGDDKPEENPIETTAQSDTNAELNVSFDENISYTMDEEEIFRALIVEIIENGIPRHVEYTVSSSELTEDGQHIKVVISAEGIEKEILLPYDAESETYIRKDLKPIYELLSKTGEKSVSLNFAVDSFDATGNAESLAFGAIVNLTENGAEFALVDSSNSDDKSLVLYKDGVLTVCGVAVEALSKYAESIDGVVTTEIDFDGMFTSLSSAFDAFDSIIDTVSKLNVDVKKENGVYYVNTDSTELKQLLPALQVFLNRKYPDVSQYVDMLYEQLDGTLKDVNEKINLLLSINDNGIIAELRLINEEKGEQTSIICSLNVAATVAELPAPADTAELKDIEITVPFAIPTKDTKVTLKAVIRLADILTASGGDYVTASVALNDKENAARFVINDKYIYVDLSGFVPSGEGIDPLYIAFYQAFEIDGEPVSIFDYLPKMISGQGDTGEEIVDEVDYNEPEYDYYGYGVCDIDDIGMVILPIGATESDLRSKLFVYVYDENDEQIEVTDYQIIGFDSSASFSDYLDITFYNIETSYDVVIRDPANEDYDGMNIDPLVVALGTNVASVQDEIYADIYMTDGNVSWSLYKNGFTINKVDEVEVTGEYEFAEKGNHTLTVTYDANGKQAETILYVYDPENLEVDYVDFQDEIYVPAGITEEEIRDYIDILVKFDNNDFENIADEDYQIVGFNTGDDFVEVQWNEYTHKINIEYYDVPIYTDDQPAENFDISMRADLLASEDIVAAISDIYEQNKDLFKSVFVIDKENKSMRILVNSKEGGDILDIVNLFFGIPTEEGFEDIDDSKLIAIINSTSGTTDIDSIFKTLIGVDFADFISNLCIDVGVSDEDGFAVNIELSDGANVKYFATGIGFDMVEHSTESIVLTEEEITTVQSFSNFPFIFVMLLLSVFAA